jgi:hypothetical protein
LKLAEKSPICRKMRAARRMSVEAGQARCARCGKFIEPEEPGDLGHVDGSGYSVYSGPSIAAATARPLRMRWSAERCRTRADGEAGKEKTALISHGGTPSPRHRERQRRPNRQSPGCRQRGSCLVAPQSRKRRGIRRSSSSRPREPRGPAAARPGCSWSSHTALCARAFS